MSSIRAPSALIFEKDGVWRLVSIGILITFLFLPLLPLLTSVFEGNFIDLWTESFQRSLSHSLLLALILSSISLIIGLFLGTLGGLYSFRFQSVLWSLLLLPIILPSFLWAIALSGLKSHLKISDMQLPGFVDGLLSFSTFTIPLVIAAAYVSAQSITKTQVDAARLAGGEFFLIKQCMKATFPIALLVALLGGLMSLTDPGPSQILSFPSVASEILISFSAFYDFSVATRQSLIVSMIAVIFSLPFVVLLAPKLADQFFSKAMRTGSSTYNSFYSKVTFLGFVVLITFLVLLPLTSFLGSVFNGFQFERSLSEIRRTFWQSLWYSGGAALVATVLGLFLSLVVGKKPVRYRFILPLLLLHFSIPGILFSLGAISAGANLSSSWDFLFRSEGVVILILAFRFLPISTLLLLHSVNRIPSSWAEAAALRGVSFFLFLKRIIIPRLGPSILCAFLLVALLASSEVGIPLLLRPPGKDSLPVAIFTIMANAPESLVATLCLLYLSIAALALLALHQITKRLSHE